CERDQFDVRPNLPAGRQRHGLDRRADDSVGRAVPVLRVGVRGSPLQPAGASLAGFFLFGMLVRVFPIVLALLMQVPALPPLAVERFPAEARASIEAAYREAVARAEDGAAAGRLGMVLQAWEQWDSALAVYRRAQGLAPRTFDWWYLAGIIETRLGRASD